jgi:hypothetical protein
MVWLLLMGGSVLERRACISGSLIPQEGAGIRCFCLFLAGFCLVVAGLKAEPKQRADVLTEQAGNFAKAFRIVSQGV